MSPKQNNMFIFGKIVLHCLSCFYELGIQNYPRGGLLTTTAKLSLCISLGSCSVYRFIKCIFSTMTAQFSSGTMITWIFEELISFALCLTAPMYSSAQHYRNSFFRKWNLKRTVSKQYLKTTLLWILCNNTLNVIQHPFAFCGYVSSKWQGVDLVSLKKRVPPISPFYVS